MNTLGDILPPGPVSWAALPDAFVGRVAAYCCQEGLVGGPRRLLVACSGGADSLALLAILAHPGFARAARLEGGPELVVGHVDHGLRPDSADDAAAVARLAEGLGLPCIARSLLWPDAASGKGRAASEAEARVARLTALTGLAQEAGADAIALGHTASDQLETLLMRLLRGSGLRGLAGMAPRRGLLVRPLLCLSGQETRELVAALGWRPREDASNASDDFLRNRMRHGVVPRLLAENPRAAEAAHRTARVLREELEALDALEDATWEQLGSLGPGGPSVSGEALRRLPRSLAARVVRRMWRIATGQERHFEEVIGGGELGREHASRVLDLLTGDEGTSRLDLPGGAVALRTYDRLVICARGRIEDPGDVEVPVPGPGLYEIDALGLTLEVLDTSVESGAVRPGGDPGRGPVDRAQGGTGENEATTSLLEETWLGGLGEPGSWRLCVRNSRPGDRVRIPSGHKKISDLMVDHKVPAPARRRTPILVGGDEVLWIPGLYQRALEAPSGTSMPGPETVGAASAGTKENSTYRLVFRFSGSRRSR